LDDDGFGVTPDNETAAIAHAEQQFNHLFIFLALHSVIQANDGPMVMTVGPIDHEPMVAKIEYTACDGFIKFCNACGHGISIRLVKSATGQPDDFRIGAQQFDLGSNRAVIPVPDRPHATITPPCVINGLLDETRRNVRTALQVSRDAGARSPLAQSVMGWDGSFPSDRSDLRADRGGRRPMGSVAWLARQM
jgi:hypothetical protein